MSCRIEPPVGRIHLLDAPPRADNLLDQREITIQSYEARVAFDFDAFAAGLESGWLSPQVRFGVVERREVGGTDALHVVLGLQDEISVRTYDYDERRPLWYAWRDVIVDTVRVHYSRAKDGTVHFTTTGGGRRITDERILDFNAAFLGIPKAAVSKRQFDLDKLRELCFERFVERLYMVRFSGPSAEEYQSIDLALFQSRKYIDPNTKRLQEIRDDGQARIESFDSDVSIHANYLAEPILVRFFVRGLSGSLRLRFPKIHYKKAPASDAELVRIFYDLVDVTASAILDANCYTHQRRSLAELEKLHPELELFPDMIDLAPYREVLNDPEAQREFIAGIDVGGHWSTWKPRLWALDELAVTDVVVTGIAKGVAERVWSDAEPVVRLLAACQEDARAHRVGATVAGAMADTLQAIRTEMRAHVETALLAWALDREDAWDVDPESGEVRVMGLRWRLEDLDVDVWPPVLQRLTTVIDAHLREATGDVGALLAKYAWCMEAAKALPEYHAKLPAALRLVSTGRVPASVAEANKVLRKPVDDLRALDRELKAQFGLSPWPSLIATSVKDAVVIRNDGIGSALRLEARPDGMLFADKDAPPPADVLPGATITVPMKGGPALIDVAFEKFGERRRVSLQVARAANVASEPEASRTLHAKLDMKRLADARKLRERIDPKGIVVGSSPALLEVFAQIHHANLLGDGAAPVLILGERGSGKTHIAQLLHDSSARGSGPFEMRNAGGGGGDPNIQRGEWIGYGRNHGIQGIDKSGRPGHLMKARGGTLFIDEVGGLSEALQYTFLYVLEGQPIEKVGGDTFKPDVRCIFATNADVEKAAANGTLRADFLDRIPIRIHIPPLRDRLGDVLLLADHFAGADRFTERARIALLRHAWPGNIRTLQSTVQKAVAGKTADGAPAINLEHLDLPAEVVAPAEALDKNECRRELWTLADKIAKSEGFEQRDGLQKRACEILGVGPSQASKMYAEFGLTAASDGKAGAAQSQSGAAGGHTDTTSGRRTSPKPRRSRGRHEPVPHRAH